MNVIQVRKGIIVLMGVLFLVTGLSNATLSQESGAPNDKAESMRSSPPDTTPYFRNKKSEDDHPKGKPAIPPGHLRGPKHPKGEKPIIEPEETVPDDQTLSGTSALGEAGAISELPILIVDTVVSNTNANLTNTDTANDGETSVAVNPANPNEIVVSAFSGPPNNNNRSSWDGGAANAIIYHSLDGGLTWSQQGVPPPVNIPVTGVNDWAFDYGRNNQMSGTVLNNSDVVTGTTTNPANLASWLWNNVGNPAATEVTNINTASSIGNCDQPWLLTNPDPLNLNQDNVYVAYDDFSGNPDMQVAVSLGQNPPDFTRDVQVGQSTGGVNPGLRMAKDTRTGFIYALWERCTSNCATNNAKNIDFMLNRSTDGGNTWSLNGSAAGIVVASGDSFQPRPKFGTVNALLGGIEHATVDSYTGTLYYVYADRDNVSGVQRLALRRVTGDGAGGVNIGGPSWVSPDLNDAAIPSAAVVEDGTLGVFYYTFDGFSSDDFPIFTAWLALSEDEGATFTQHRLLTFLSSAQDNNNSRQRVLGDYMQMKAVGNCFYGAFTGNGAPFGRPISNHDPIFFKACTGPQLQVNESLEVPPTCVGSTSMDTLEACNAGLDTLILTDIDSDNPLFSVTPKTGGFPINISPDACVSFEVNFSPALNSDAGPQTGTLTITSNDPSQPETFVSVSSSASLPDMTATLQADGVFGDVVVGDTKLLNLEVLNQSGVCELSVIDLARTAGSTDFDFAGLTDGLSFPVILQPGANVDLPIKFTPTSFDPVSATFNLTTDDPDSPTTFAVNGNSPAPKITVTGDLSFGQVCADVTSERDVEICNVGLVNPLLDVNATLVGAGCDDFEIVGNPFPADISHDFCVPLTVRYTPTAVGDHNDCDLQITSNDPDVPEINLPLTGSTPAPEIDVAADLTFPATVVQGVGPCSSERAFPIQNNGTCPLTITDISITANDVEYSLDALPSFPIILDHGELAGDGDLRVVFSPYVLAYQSEGEITVTYETDPITHDTMDVTRNVCGEGTNTGARVLVTQNGVPLDSVDMIRLNRVNANRNKDKVDTVDNSRNLSLITVPASGPCPEIKFHKEYGAEGNPIQLLPGSYTVTVQTKIDNKMKKKTVGFDVSTCDFNPTIVVNF